MEWDAFQMELRQREYMEEWMRIFSKNKRSEENDDVIVAEQRKIEKNLYQRTRRKVWNDKCNCLST